MIEDYSIVVITQYILGLDHTNSIYKCVPGTDSIMRLDKAVYMDRSLDGHDLARDEEYLSNLMVSNRLCDILRGKNGIGLYELE